MNTSTHSITDLLNRHNAGEHGALDEVFSLLYDEMKAPRSKLRGIRLVT